MLAHAIVGSPLWRVDVEKQRANSDAIAESVEASASEALFDAKRREALALLGFDPECPTVTNGYAGDHGLPGLFLHLTGLSDETVIAVLAIVMGETLAAGSAMVELLGALLNIDMASVWQATSTGWIVSRWNCSIACLAARSAATALFQFRAMLRLRCDACAVVGTDTSPEMMDKARMTSRREEVKGCIAVSLPVRVMVRPDAGVPAPRWAVQRHAGRWDYIPILDHRNPPGACRNAGNLHHKHK